MSTEKLAMTSPNHHDRVEGAMYGEFR